MSRRSPIKRRFEEVGNEDEVQEDEGSIQVAQVVGGSDEEGDPNEDDEYHSEAITAEAITGDAISDHSSYPSVKIIKVVPLPHARSEVWSYFGFIASDEGEIQDKKKAICKICATTLSYSGNTTNLFTHLKAMHPEANPQKMAPTNKSPKSGMSRSNKKRLYDVVSGTPVITLNTPHRQASQEENSVVINPVIVRLNETNDPKTSLDSTEEHQPSSNGDIVLQSPSKTANKNVCMSDDVTRAVVDMLAKDCRPVSLVQGKGFQGLLRLLVPNYKIPDTRLIESMLERRYEELRREFIIRGMDVSETE
jgi:hypothetical protein